jgi:hypothetical protein
MWGWASRGREAAALMALNSSARRGCVVDKPTLQPGDMQHAAFRVHLVEFHPAGLRHAQAMPEHQEQHYARIDETEDIAPIQNLAKDQEEQAGGPKHDIE